MRLKELISFDAWIRLPLMILALSCILPSSSMAANACLNLFGPPSVYEQTVRWIDGKIVKVEEWAFTKEQEAEFDAIAGNDLIPPEKRIEDLYRGLVAARINQLSPASQAMAKLMARDALTQKSIYSRSLGWLVRKLMGPHYNPIFNRTAISIRDSNNPTPNETLLAIHEVEHGIHRNTAPLTFVAGFPVMALETFSFFRTPASPLFLRHVEARAVGAQWELVSRVPKAIRDQIVFELERGPGRLKDTEEDELNSLDTDSMIRNIFAAEKVSGNEDPQFLEKKAIQVLGKFIATKSASDKKKILKKYTAVKEPWQGNLPFELNAEFKQRIRREVYSQQLGSIGRSTEQVFLASLKNASLSKEDFVAQLSPTHGYTLRQLIGSHYSLLGFRYLLLIDGMTKLLNLYVINSQGGILTADSAKFLAYDFQWMWKFTAYLLGFS
jgi:hypothetical protein